MRSGDGEIRGSLQLENEVLDVKVGRLFDLQYLVLVVFALQLSLQACISIAI